MLKNFKLASVALPARRSGPQFWLLVSFAGLALANFVALIVYFFPPGGSQSELMQKREELRANIAGARVTAVRLRTVSGKVELGSEQAADFEARYFLPERLAYDAVIGEIQRMAKATSVEEREANYAKEPIEGSDDLSLLSISARFQGSYQNLLRFLHEEDKSPMLLMVDQLRASPQQKTGEIDTEIRFQVIVQDSPATIGAGGQP